MERNSRFIIYDGTIKPADEPIVSVESRALMYGEGLFETFRSYTGQTLFLEQHLQRMAEGIDLLGIPKPPLLALKNIQPYIVELLCSNNLLNSEAIVRLQVWRDGKRGYLPANNDEAHFSITASECPKAFNEPTLATVETCRIPARALPSGYKLSNGINYILAARAAAKQGANDALMQTIAGKISETTIANIFWVKGDKIFTPSAKCDLMPGITRKVIIDLAGDDVKEDEFELDHLLEADAVFLTNSVREVLPVKAVNNHSFSTKNETVSELKNRFIGFREKNLESL